ncbi:hypothetical protein SAMN06295909_2104 [Plantibacter sp. VKM Ac-1784]|uniref:Glycosyltransferase 2-like domain-containing protein n=1 Tax=Plantibacter elymi (nom. nud.) TaxID=199708 RepID=A0ABY1RCR9_9MICO|nr:glycosyltransferase family 2 protein [Plantibacter sp. VKM Ac-1784]SMQ70533.1 hypothetical protein SAMN06295909_2104 [Plantibacter sp. VKM Ac-1784]
MDRPVTACIVMYRNDRDKLRAAIDSTLGSPLVETLYLVDNSPTDELRDLADDPRVEYLHNPSNPGFGAAHNLAIAKVLGRSKFHMVVNPDVYFEPEAIEELHEFMLEHPEVGHVMPKVLYPDGSLQYLVKRNPSVFDLFARRFLPGPLKPLVAKRMARYEYRDIDENPAHDYSKTMFDVPYLSGCFMFLRTSTLHRVGYFDERIFMYIEDADLTRRFLQVSRTAYYPGATIHHHFAKGSHHNRKLMWYSIQGAFVYFRTWGWLGR